ncbi:MAG TPA: hypothetical protein VF458_18345 [Ktedonobacteraceae bacterium]
MASIVSTGGYYEGQLHNTPSNSRETAWGGHQRAGLSDARL